MKKQDYNTSLTVNATAQQAFKSINNVSAWWTTAIEGASEKLNDVFTVSFGETFITLKIVEWVPYKKITWQVIDCYKHWLKDKKEWMNTSVQWEIEAGQESTQINFTHIGLVPGIECYNGCEKAWDAYIQESLFKLIPRKNDVPKPA